MISRHVDVVLKIQAGGDSADHVLVDLSSAGVSRGHGGQPRHDGVGELGKYRGHAGTGGADGTSYWRLLRDGGRGVLGRTTLDVAELVTDSGLDTLEVGYELQLNGGGKV